MFPDSSQRRDSPKMIMPSVITEEILPAEDVSRFSALLSGEEFRRELGRLFVSQWRWGKPEEVQVKPLKAHKDRCTFDVRVKTEQGWRSIIGKVYSNDRPDVMIMQKAVAQSGFGPDGKFAIAQPLAYVSSLRILFEEKIQGKLAMELFLNGSPDEQTEAARRSGKWLARFHSYAPRLGRTTAPKELLPQISYWSERIKRSGEPFASKSESLFRRLDSTMPDSVESCCGHGSFIPEHVFLNGPQTIAIDLDEHDVADPSRDLAWFIVSLERLGLKQGLSLRAHDREVTAFLETYVSARNLDASKQLPFFKAVECLHRAHRDLYKRTVPIPEWSEAMIDEGLSSL